MELEVEADSYQQYEDEIIVALGSLGILPSEIVARIEKLEEVVKAAKEVIRVAGHNTPNSRQWFVDAGSLQALHRSVKAAKLDKADG